MNLLCRLVAKHLNMWVNSRILMEVYFVCFYIYVMVEILFLHYMCFYILWYRVLLQGLIKVYGFS